MVDEIDGPVYRERTSYWLNVNSTLVKTENNFDIMTRVLRGSTLFYCTSHVACIKNIISKIILGLCQKASTF